MKTEDRRQKTDQMTFARLLIAIAIVSGFALSASAAPVDLSLAFNRDTIAESPRDVSLNQGYRAPVPPDAQTETSFFLSNDYPDPGGDGVGDNLPVTGALQVGDVSYQLGPYVGRNTVYLWIDDSAVTIDVPDGKYTNFSALYTGVYEGHPANGDIVFNYANTSSRETWDLADNADLEAGLGKLDAGGVYAIEGLDSIVLTNGQQQFHNQNRVLISQTIPVDDSQVLESVTFSIGPPFSPALPPINRSFSEGIYAVDLQPAGVPEPTTWALALGGACSLLAFFRRR